MAKASPTSASKKKAARKPAPRKNAVLAGSAPADAYLNALPSPRREELREIDAFVRRVCPNLGRGMYGTAIVGYGPYEYVSDAGGVIKGFHVALSSRAQYIALYVPKAGEHAAKFPKADVGGGCIRFKRLADIDLKVVEALLRKLPKK